MKTIKIQIQSSDRKTLNLVIAPIERTRTVRYPGPDFELMPGEASTGGWIGECFKVPPGFKTFMLTANERGRAIKEIEKQKGVKWEDYLLFDTVHSCKLSYHQATILIPEAWQYPD